MAYVYVLQSEKNGKRYVGSTTNEPCMRLKEHNEGNTAWTRKYRPFSLIYQEKCSSTKEAIERERYLKSGSSREWLLRRLPR